MRMELHTVGELASACPRPDDHDDAVNDAVNDNDSDSAANYVKNDTDRGLAIGIGFAHDAVVDYH